METYPTACVAAVSTVNWSLFRAHCSWWLPAVCTVVSAPCAETEQWAEGVDAINESVCTPALDPMCCAKPEGDTCLAILRIHAHEEEQRALLHQHASEQSQQAEGNPDGGYWV